MEKTRNIPVGKGDAPGCFEMIELFGVISGRRSVREMFDSPTEAPAHNLVTGAEYTGPKEPFYVPAPCRVVGLMINGEVCAGFPSPAEEELRDVISFDEYLVAHPETSFLLSVTGDSMSGAGIMEKDLVIVERGRQPKNGDIILAEVDGNWTMKYFRKKGKNITLEAANPQYPPIVPQTELRIAGVITALVRKYHE
ncbi:MAG: S24 family peptidase [Smithella sp.]|jgi:repressor LexA